MYKVQNAAWAIRSVARLPSLSVSAVTSHLFRPAAGAAFQTNGDALCVNAPHYKRTARDGRDQQGSALIHCVYDIKLINDYQCAVE